MDLIEVCDKQPSVAELLNSFNEQSVSDYLVVYLRLVTSGYLQREDEFFQYFIEGGRTVREFCQQVRADISSYPCRYVDWKMVYFFIYACHLYCCFGNGKSWDTVECLMGKCYGALYNRMDSDWSEAVGLITITGALTISPLRLQCQFCTIPE